MVQHRHIEPGRLSTQRNGLNLHNDVRSGQTRQSETERQAGTSGPGTLVWRVREQTGRSDRYKQTGWCGGAANRQTDTEEPKIRQV
jgi:hypothetical protein